MVKISYTLVLCMITLLWAALRIYFCKKAGAASLRRELQLLLVYICIVVVARFTFFPFEKLNGRIQPLIFDPSLAFPFRINALPFVNLLDYAEAWETKLNIIGNTAMFIPVGIVWPAVFKRLDTHGRVIGAGVGFSLVIELLQLPFFHRVTDIDDLILNSLGYVTGYGIYLAARKLRRK